MVEMVSDSTVIAQLVESHERLARVLDQVGKEGLESPSACSDWTIGRTVAHIGSGAEIAQAGLAIGLAGGTSAVEGDAMQEVWSAYDALDDAAATERAMPANQSLLDAFAALSPAELADVRVPFFTGPVPVSMFASFRLAEHAVHVWDVEVMNDPKAELDPAAAATVFGSVVMALVGRLATVSDLPAQLLEVVIDNPERHLGLTLADPVGVSEWSTDHNTDAVLNTTMDAFVRLVYGRLSSEHTPDSTSIRGPVSLDDLRAMFKGF